MVNSFLATTLSFEHCSTSELESINPNGASSEE